MTITLTLEQANVLVQLLDTAVKAAGLPVAGSALFFQDLLKKAHGASLTEAPKTDTV